MLQVTEAAMGIIKQIRNETPGVDDDATARIQLVGGEEGANLGFGFSEEPIEGDTKVLASDDIEVYLAPELVDPLDGAVVDAVEADGGQQLVIREQEAGTED